MQFFRQFLPQGLVAGLSQQGEHILLIRLHPRLVEGIHVQQVAGQAAGPVGIMTDYEAKFYELGKNINRCVATMEPWTEPEEEPAEAAPVEASSVE